MDRFIEWDAKHGDASRKRTAGRHQRPDPPSLLEAYVALEGDRDFLEEQLSDHVLPENFSCERAREEGKCC